MAHFQLRQPAYLENTYHSAGAIIEGSADTVPSGSMPVNADGSAIKDAKPVSRKASASAVSAPSAVSGDALEMVAALLKKVGDLEARLAKLESPKK